MLLIGLIFFMFQSFDILHPNISIDILHIHLKYFSFGTDRENPFI